MSGTAVLELEAHVLIVLALVAVGAGFLDTLAGGGGLLTVPALLLAGVPPVQALATNKLQSSAGTLTATVGMARLGLLRFQDIRTPFLASLVGSAAGATLVQVLDVRSLDHIVPVVLVGIAVYFVLVPSAGDVECQPRIGRGVYRFGVVPAIGLYDGMFGPGTGSFFSLAGVGLRGQHLVQATAHAKAFNLASNMAALGVFIVGGKVVWSIGAVMILGQACGASLGSMAVARGGVRLIRPLIVLMSLSMTARYLWDCCIRVFW
ncbi:TSUP family transporter [Haematospirillum sp. H1815]|uniref:TSUP family transporter n=1 Tax=Haematospirillum sp. H1815 TaxID=2723108 RepID=UPI00143B011C|nr:TSUP family transporter [Haematospirillum sp. H1815]NKD78128.1 TSUP family transporter [Haematospirillum sp. H1815]